MINNLFVRNKLEYIKQYYRELEGALEKYPIKDYIKDTFQLHAYERIFQLIVDEMLDINTHIIAKKDLEKPRDYQGTFAILGRAEILPDDFAFKIAPVVGLRNIIVHRYEHRYEKLNPELFLKYIYKEREDFLKYMKLIEKYLEDRE